MKRSKEPFIDLLRQQSIGRLFMERSMWSETGEEGDPIPVDGIIPIPGGLVLCTEQGVRILELSGGEVKAVSSIREEHGLVDDYVVSGVFNEKTGLLYVGGNKGISAVDIKTREVMWTVSKRQGF